MGRLIDADSLIEELQKQMKTATKSTFAMVCDKCIDYLENQPTAYDVEKVVAEIEEDKFKHPFYEDEEVINSYIDRAIKAVRKGGVE